MKSILQRRMLGIVLLGSAMVLKSHAGGSGLNTVVIVNQSSSNSCELGNYYCERRQVPPENVLRITWPGGNTLWTSNDFQNSLVTPLLNMLNNRQLTNQIDYVVLSMDIPFQTSFGSALNGTTSALFYGLKSDGGSDPGVTNSYAASETIFRQGHPASAPGYSFLATMITSDSLAHAKQLVDQGVAADETQPPQSVLLAKTSDPLRNIRYTAFDNAMFNVNIRGASAILAVNSDAIPASPAWLGCETGLDKFNVTPGTFVPGAIADSFTSFGGVIFGPNTQTNLLAFINAGAAGSYGTVAEPGTDPQKFPDPQVYFYQARGLSLAEAYYQSVSSPYLGLTVAEPLSAPFAMTGSGVWNSNLVNAVLSGTPVLAVQLLAPNPAMRLQQVDLFVDGKYFETLTNLSPRAGNVLTLTLNGYPITCAVTSNATPGTVAGALADSINAPAVTNNTGVMAFVHGDRIELRSSATNPWAVPFYVADSTPAYTPGLAYRVLSLPDSFPPGMIPLGLDKNGVFRMQLQLPGTLPYVIEASTNLMNWLSIGTNEGPGLFDFQDPDAANHPARFYRLIWPDPEQPPRISAPAILPDGEFSMHVESVPGLPCAILVSTNLVDWSPMTTNLDGGPLDFVDVAATNSVCRFYRAWLLPPAPPPFSVLNLSTGVTLVRIDSATRPYTVEVSTNAGSWKAIATNFAIGQIQTSAASSIGSADVLSTFLSASRPTFLNSDSRGLQQYRVVSNALPIGSWLQFAITQTNGQSVVVCVTNFSAGATPANLAWQVCQQINTNTALLGDDGVAADDFAVDQTGTATFNLRARSPGSLAAEISVLPKRYGVTILPSSQRSLTQNLSDLETRNHLYVTAGAASFSVNFPLDTTTLSDGYHDLTAVAYEGSHVRTQTRVTVPVRISNSALSATLTLLDLPDPSPVQGIYHIQVTASASDVSLITLYSTGGALGSAVGQQMATFPIFGASLRAGLHPFYAVVETSSGHKFRTATSWVRLQN